MRRSRAVVSALAAMVLSAAAVAAGAALPAAAQAGGGLTLTLAQTTGLQPGQYVDLEVGGIPETAGTQVDLWLCDDPVAAGVEQSVLEHTCAPGAIFEANGATTWSASIQALEVYHGGNLAAEPQYYCADEPFDCSVVASLDTGGTGPVTDLVAVPVDVVPSPLLVTGDAILDPLGAMTVYLSGDPGATLQLAQCVNFPDVPRDLPNCLAGPQVTLSADGRGHADMTASATQAVAGTTYDCDLRPCEVVVFDAAGSELDAATIPGSYPAGKVELSRSTGLEPGESVQATVQNGAGIAYLAECVAPVLQGALTPTEGCTLLSIVFGPSNTYTVRLDDHFLPALAGSPERVCADDPGGCFVGLGNTDGSAAWYVPISFAGTATLALTPDHGLLDGQEMAADLSGLTPGRAYELLTCGPFGSTPDACHAEGSVTGSESGTATATVVARQRPAAGNGQVIYCRDSCRVVARSETGRTAAQAPFVMSTGSLAAAPATGLADGQEVTLSGTGVQPSYDGPLIWIIHTGQWVLSQCAADVTSDPTLLGIFTHCTTAVGGPIHVPGSTFSQPVTVAASVNRILGGTTDCTASPGACVAILARMEGDGALTLLSTPLTFGSA
jgi:hypothetical protein